MNANELIDTLFFIVNTEIAKPAKEINTKIVLSCVEAAGVLDTRFRYTNNQRTEFADLILNDKIKVKLKSFEAEQKGKIKRGTNEIKDKRFPIIKISKKVKIAIIAAIISILIAGIAVYAFTDIFSLFFNDPREKLEWKDGESRQIDNYEMIITSELQQFESIEELKSVIDVPIVCPEGNSEDFQITGIYYKPLKDKPVVYIDYTFNDVQINYAIRINTNNPSQEEINSYRYERIETRNNNLFFIMESEIGYQALARIGDNVYIISSGNKDDIIHFIKNVKEL